MAGEAAALLEGLLPLRHETSTQLNGRSVTVTVSLADERLDADGLFVLLRVEGPRSLAEMEILLVPAPFLEEPGRVRAFCAGWVAALPALLDQQSEPWPIETLVCPLVLDDPALVRAAEFRDALLDPDGPMRRWRSMIWGEEALAEDAAEADWEAWRADRWPPVEELPAEAAAAALAGRRRLAEVAWPEGLVRPASLSVFLAFLHGMPDDARPAWALLGLLPDGVLQGGATRRPDEPPELVAALRSPTLRLGFVQDHPAFPPAGVGAIHAEGGRWWAGRSLLDAVRALLPQVPVDAAFDPLDAVRARRFLAEWIDALALADEAAIAQDAAAALEAAPARWRRPQGSAGFGVVAPGDPLIGDLHAARAALAAGEPARALQLGRELLVSGDPDGAPLLRAAYAALGRDALAARL